MRSKHPGINLVSAVCTLEEKIENLSSSAHVIHAISKQAISRR